MRSSGPAALWHGAWLPLAGARLVLGDRRLLLLALAPALVTLLAAIGAGAGVAHAGDALLSWAWARPALAEGEGWMRAGWSHLALWAWQGAWWVAAFAAVALAALAAARVATAPVMDFLSERAMELLDVRPPADGRVIHGRLPLARQVALSVWRASGRLALLAAGWLLLALLVVVPGGAALATPLGMLWTAAWLFVDTALYALQWTGAATLAEVGALVRAQPALCLGFAAGTGALMLVPFAGLFVTPAAVAGACLLVARAHAPQASEPLLAA